MKYDSDEWVFLSSLLVYDILQKILWAMDFHITADKCFWMPLLSTCTNTTGVKFALHLRECPNAAILPLIWKKPLHIVKVKNVSVFKISHNTCILTLLLHPNIITTRDSRRRREQMGAGGHQLWPVSQVTTLAIVTSRLEPHVYIPRSCSGSVGSCPFTSNPSKE